MPCRRGDLRYDSLRQTTARGPLSVDEWSSILWTDPSTTIRTGVAAVGLVAPLLISSSDLFRICQQTRHKHYQSLIAQLVLTKTALIVFRQS